MLIQGTNSAICLDFDEEGNPSTFKDISVIVYPRNSSNKNIILIWSIEDVIIDGNTVICPINQDELLPPKLNIEEDINICVEVKWLGADDSVYQSKTFYDFISYRRDETILGE